MRAQNLDRVRRAHRRRAGQGGAAMVEGIVVMSVFVIFLGLIVWTRRAYGMKLDMQQRTRSDTLYFASHGCENTGGGVGQAGAGGTVGVDNSAAAGAANRAPSADKAAVNQSWNRATGNLAGTASWQVAYDANATGGGNSSISYTKRAWTSNVKAESTVTCNEKKYDSQLTAWFSFGVQMLRTGGGFAGLFGG